VVSAQLSFTTNIRINGCETSDYSVEFTPSYETGTTYLWEFGDGLTSSDVIPTHIYSKPGVYSVTLSIDNITPVNQEVDVLLIPFNNTDFLIDSTSDNVSQSSFLYGFISEYFDLEIIEGSEQTDTLIKYQTGPDEWASTSNKSYTFSWFVEGEKVSSFPDPLYYFSETGSYDITLIIEDDFGCKDTSVFSDLYPGELLVVKDAFILDSIPNVFTPNGDLINDVFTVKVDGVKSVYRFQIYAPTGVLVYQSEARSVRWDGKNFSGQDVAEGTYFYVLEAISGNTQNIAKGPIHLFR